MDIIEGGGVVDFEKALLDSIRENGKDILEAIRDEGAISDEVEEKLKSFIADFLSSYSS